MKNVAIALCVIMLAAAAGRLYAQSAGNAGSQVSSWTYTAFPLYGAAVTPNDATRFAPSNIRADADGAVTARCAGDGPTGTALTLNMVAGEFFPCQVIMVLDTGTDAIAIHRFY
jgi:hypothetical protein